MMIPVIAQISTEYYEEAENTRSILKNPPKPILGQILIIYYITKENLGQSEKKKTQNRHMVFSFKFGSLTVIGHLMVDTAQPAREVYFCILQMHFMRHCLVCEGNTGTRLPIMTVRYLLSNEVLKRV